MHLYKIYVKHFSKKDSHKSVETFLLAENDELVYRWIDKEKTYGTWTDRDKEDGLIDVYNDNFVVIGKETYKSKMLRIKGELNDEDLELDDLYYGKTIYGWGKMNDEMIGHKVASLKGLDILVEL